MAASYWIKLYTEILDDPKMGRLPDNVWRRCIELFLLAGKQNQRDGRLPDIEDAAYLLRVSIDQLGKEIEQLVITGILEYREGVLYVTKFGDRQSKSEPADRMKEYRRRKKEEDETRKAEEESVRLQKVSEIVTLSHAIGNAVTHQITDEQITESESEGDTDVSLAQTPPPRCKNEGCNYEPLEGDEHGYCAYCKMLVAWKYYFPDKPQPRHSTLSIRRKVNGRFRSQHFRDNWLSAIKQAGKSTFLQGSSWFDFEWFVKNDEHYERCLNGKYDDSPGPAVNGHKSPPAASPPTDDRKARIARMINNGRTS
jgi:hypothetical protein